MTQHITEKAGELLPCPFCGGTDLTSGGDDKVVIIWCRSCEAQGPNQYGSGNWNHRAALPHLQCGTEEPRAEPVDGWLIRKNGYFYRPNAKGYTASIYEAGIYTREEAESEARIEPGNITAHPIAEFKQLAEADLANAKRIIAYIDGAALSPASAQGVGETIDRRKLAVECLMKWGQPTSKEHVAMLLSYADAFCSMSPPALPSQDHGEP